MTDESAPLRRERLSLMTREDGLYTFWAPAMDAGYFQWWNISDGVLSITTQAQPRRVRCFPLISIEWWEFEHDAEVPC